MTKAEQTRMSSTDLAALADDLEGEASRAANMADDVRRGKWANLLDEATCSIAFYEDVRVEAVRELRALGKSWEDVGEALGISRQAAWERWREA